jgi:hypothetical protein
VGIFDYFQKAAQGPPVDGEPKRHAGPVEGLVPSSRPLTEGEDVPGGTGAFSRRLFLEGMAGAAAYAYLVRLPAPRFLKDALAHGVVQGAAAATPTIDPSWDYFVQVVRDTDLCLLDFYFYHFNVGTDGFGRPAFIANGSASSPSTVLVRFPPQHLAEAAYPASNLSTAQNSPSAPTFLFCDPSPILSGLAGQTQLSFNFGSSGEIPLSNPMKYEDLLNWSGWQLNVPLVAQWPPPPPPDGATAGPIGVYPTAPGPMDTFIEFPYGLLLAPSVWNPFPGTSLGYTTGFSNNVDPLTSSGGVTDIFASSLQQPPYHADSLPDVLPGLSAVWANDLSGPYIFPSGGSNERQMGSVFYTLTDVTPQTHIQYGEGPS